MTELFRAAEEANIEVIYCQLPLNESISVQGEDSDFVLMDYTLLQSGASERVHLAHEIGHSINGAFYAPYSPFEIRQKHENKADRWAIENLVSPDELDSAVAEGYTDIWSLAEYFGVTEDFMRKVVCWYTYGNLEVELYF